MHSSPTPDLEEFTRRCEGAGVPVTSQRRAVFEAFVPRLDHPTVDEIYAAVKCRGVSLATTYRALETLAELGLAKRVAHPGSAVRFDPNTTEHHHFLCDVCGAIQDVAPEGIRIDVSASELDVREASVFFRGTCARCA